MGVSNAWGASPIYSIGDVYVTGSMNGWKTNLSDWKLGSGNHCTKTFYLEESETNYTFKLYLKSGYYTVNAIGLPRRLLVLQIHYLLAAIICK